MSARYRIALLLWVIGLLSCRRETQASSGPVGIPAGIDHTDWDRLLTTYVDERGLVGYAAWKASPDREALDLYLGRFAGAPEPPAEGRELAASLINCYNALTIRWILENYPTPSIRSLGSSFSAARHRVGGRRVSLDAIEHKTLRPLVGYRVHAALVCAARSCPPLSRSAYRADRLDGALDTAMRRWLAREDLNRFQPTPPRAEVSEIFSWFREDFEKAGGVRRVLLEYAPASARPVLESQHLEIGHLSYDWSLNDKSGEAVSYGGLRLLWDRFKDWKR